VAQRLKQQGYTSGCSVGDTIPYIICHEQVCHLVIRSPIKGQLVYNPGKWEMFFMKQLTYF